MKSKIEQKWWFLAVTGILAALVTRYVMETAGVDLSYSFSQVVLGFFCFTGIQRAFSFTAWLAILCFSPSSKASDIAR
ncbi:MAG: hypothetical protein JO269_02690 [Burkholderiaceae bacterium]|nr:hypothetical protein [Burkholderiaceae bacterium]